MIRTAAAIAGAALMIASLACSGERQTQNDYVARIGDPAAGRRIIHDAGCGSCHTIPGVRGADGLVGPPLTSFARRSFIGGTAPNTPENLVRWVQNPRTIEPHTAMPNLGLDDRQARAVAAYLYTLR